MSLLQLKDVMQLREKKKTVFVKCFCIASSFLRYTSVCLSFSFSFSLSLASKFEKFTDKTVTKFEEDVNLSHICGSYRSYSWTGLIYSRKDQIGLNS